MKKKEKKMKSKTREVNENQLTNWLGSSNTYQEAIDTLLLVLNNNYTGKEMAEDILNYCDQ